MLTKHQKANLIYPFHAGKVNVNAGNREVKLVIKCVNTNNQPSEMLVICVVFVAKLAGN
jgi:hypothetical protein